MEPLRRVHPPDALVLSCEHGGNRVPARYAPLFRGAGRALATHRGWDAGALPVARRMARRLRVPLHASMVSRLVVDLNRSLHRRDLFSEFTRPLAPAERQAVLARYYYPYRDRLEGEIRGQVERGRRVLHVPVHTFAPVLRGDRRRCDLGILYEPGRAWERRLALRLKELLSETAPALRVRRNYPYRGTHDGFSTLLRRRFGKLDYACLELEISQRLAREPAALRRLSDSLTRALGRLRG
jgi:predicted N-formylglutamate amidohydrolase